MANWQDLVADATAGPLIAWDANVIEGRDWRFEWPALYAMTDRLGQPFDFDSVSNDDAYIQVTENDENPVVIADNAWTWAGKNDGTFVITVSRAATVGTAGSYATSPLGRCLKWRVKIVVFGGYHVDFIGGSFRIGQDGGIGG